MCFLLQRGKFRPRLIALCESNTDATVESVTKASFKLLKRGQLRQALDTLCALKGVGPATASGFFNSRTEPTLIYIVVVGERLYILNVFSNIDCIISRKSCFHGGRTGATRFAPEQVEILGI